MHRILALCCLAWAIPNVVHAAEIARLVPGSRDSVLVPGTIQCQMQLKMAVADAAAGELLDLPGKIGLPPDAVVPVSSPMDVEIVELALIGDHAVRYGDPVTSVGQPLAVVVGKPVGDSSNKNAAAFSITAPATGVVVEKNCAKGDVVPRGFVLFRITQLNSKAVMAEAHADELTTLERLAPEHRKWRIKQDPSGASAEWTGAFDRFDYQINPVTENGLVIGRIDDPQNKLKIGAAVRALIQLPAPPGLVGVPEGALFNTGERHYVFIQGPADRCQFSLRQVEPLRLSGDNYLIRTSLTAEQQKAGSRPVLPGERVVESGSLDLLKLLESLRAK